MEIRERYRGSEGERGNRFANALGFVFCLVSFLIIQVCVKNECKALCRVKEIDINIGEARSTQTIVNLYPITSVVIVYQIICEL